MSKFNEVKTKRGVDLAEHLVAYYQAQEDYFQDGNLIMKALKAWEGRFSTQCSEVCVCVCVCVRACVRVCSDRWSRSGCNVCPLSAVATNQAGQ